jgi:hypothetical protein
VQAAPLSNGGEESLSGPEVMRSSSSAAHESISMEGAKIYLREPTRTNKYVVIVDVYYCTSLVGRLEVVITVGSNSVLHTNRMIHISFYFSKFGACILRGLSTDIPVCSLMDAKIKNEDNIQYCRFPQFFCCCFQCLDLSRSDLSVPTRAGNEEVEH